VRKILFNSPEMRIVIGKVDQNIFNRDIIGVKILPKRGYLQSMISKTSFDFENDEMSDRTGPTQMNYDNSPPNAKA
jgi:hypothetical protein